MLDQCLHREELRENGEKHRERIRAHTRNVPRAFLCTGTIPASIGGLINLQTLNLCNNRLSGMSVLSCVGPGKHNQSEMQITRTGPLPKVMPVSLKILNLSGSYSHAHKFTGGIPAEWSSMTKLKELKMVQCGLDGECLVLVQADTEHR